MLTTGEMENERLINKTEFERPAERFARQFILRWDIHARQLDDGRYICVHRPLMPEHLKKHLQGEITLGTYLLGENSRARFIVFDADDEKTFGRLTRMAQMLAVEHIPSYPELSRRGGHLWLFLAKPMAGKLVRDFGKGLMAVHRIDDVELFPKQDRLKEGPGSLIRAPFGIHRLTRQRYDFLTLECKPLATTLEEQIQIITNPKIVSLEIVRAYASMAAEKNQKPIVEPPIKRKEVLSERIKSSITVMEFISRYVELKPTDNGAVGRCPFHDDQSPSLGVNAETNYWYCFAGCGGGSVIDFWMKWKKCDFKSAVSDLSKMLL